jgi:gentisate 1,2-dioxygenase
MSQSLGRLEDLPPDYVASLDSLRLAPLWPQMRNVLPHDSPAAVSKAAHWSFQKIRPLLLRAGELTPVEKAERRVLVLVDPGRGKGAMQVTASIYCGMQLLLPGETAPAHKHTPSAARIIVEGEGAFTVVNGEKCAMARGDLILTPTGCWHDHGHEGTQPVIWLDLLDLPLYFYLEGSYAVEAELQAPANRPDSSAVEYAQAGLVPPRGGSRRSSKYPLMRYPWRRTEDALGAGAEYAPTGQAVEMDYVNPETGDDVLPTMGFTAMMIRAGDRDRPPRRSCSSVFHVVKGRGSSTINGDSFEWTEGDTFSAPVFARVEHRAAEGPAFLIRAHDTPLQRKLDYYEERPNT